MRGVRRRIALRRSAQAAEKVKEANDERSIFCFIGHRDPVARTDCYSRPGAKGRAEGGCAEGGIQSMERTEDAVGRSGPAGNMDERRLYRRADAAANSSGNPNGADGRRDCSETGPIAAASRERQPGIRRRKCQSRREPSGTLGRACEKTT